MLKGLLLLLWGRPKSLGFCFLPHGAGELAMMCLVLFIGDLGFSAKAAKLDEVRTVDDEIIVVRWLDSPSVNSDKTSQEFTFDVYSIVSEAINVNLIGYHPDQTAMKSADLYLWLGDGGGRDYSNCAGKKLGPSGLFRSPWIDRVQPA